jgi:hypothetical protein
LPGASLPILDLVLLLVVGSIPALFVGLALQIGWLRRTRMTGAANLGAILLLLASTMFLTLGLTMVLWLMVPPALTHWLPHVDGLLVDALFRLAGPSAIATWAAVAATRAILTTGRGKGGNLRPGQPPP